MKAMGLQGIVRGRKIITTNPDTLQPCPDDRVTRAFVAQAPNRRGGAPHPGIHLNDFYAAVVINSSPASRAIR